MSIQSMTSLGRVGRILAGTIDQERDAQSTNATTTDWNAASTSNAFSSVSPTAAVDDKPIATSSNNISNSSSSNESCSNNKINLQGESILHQG